MLAEWRKRMGAEPIGNRIACHPQVLKIAWCVPMGFATGCFLQPASKLPTSRRIGTIHVFQSGSLPVCRLRAK